MDHDLVIVGAGPTGLMLACELRLAGIRPLVLERLPEPTGLSKALALTGRAIDVLEHRGLLDRFLAHAPEGVPPFSHFSMLPLDVDVVRSTGARAVFIQQARTEEILTERARELGVEIRRGHDVAGLVQDDSGVDLDLGGSRLRAKWVVGCDGGSSVVRKLAGIGFPGLPPSRVLRLADFTIADGIAREDHLALPDGRKIPYFRGGVVPLGDGVFRVITNEPYPESLDRDAPMTLEELQDSLRRTTGGTLPVTGVRWLSRFTDATRQADRYRSGRVLVAGDAAHIHLPAGGPGLSTGLQDAVNLGWKLAATILGWAPGGLLDTYHSERHPAGARVLLHTRAQGALMLPDPRVEALREVFGELVREEQVVRRLAGLLYALDTRYDMGATDPHPLVGGWAPDVELEDGTRLSSHLRQARGLLVGTECPGWKDRVDRVPAVAAPKSGAPAPESGVVAAESGVVAAESGELAPESGVAAPESRVLADCLLVRPDGYVAWAGAPGDPALNEALTRWFGPSD